MAPKESYPKAKASAAKALELDDTLAEAHLASAWVKFSFDWDYAGTEAECKRTLELNPSYATAHQWYALCLSAMGRHPEAIAEIKRAQTLDPPSLVINRDVGWVFYWARQYDQAIESYRRTIELAPSFYIAHYFFGETYEQAGRRREAVAEFRETKAHSKEGIRVWTLMAQARAYVLMDKKDEAQRVIDELTKLSNRHYVSPYLLAVVYARLEDRDRSFQWLERAYQERDPYLIYLKVEPAVDGLRSDLRFPDLLRRVGLE
jgi:tetratricopeptide (TPR) repeat protein